MSGNSNESTGASADSMANGPVRAEEQDRSVRQDKRFLSDDHIRKTGDFAAVFRLRKRVSNSILIVYAKPNDRDYSRLGLSVSKRVGGAVVRNRWKRLIRESFRLNRVDIPTGLDFVVIPVAAASVPSLTAIAASLRTLTRILAKKIARQP